MASTKNISVELVSKKKKKNILIIVTLKLVLNLQDIRIIFPAIQRYFSLKLSKRITLLSIIYPQSSVIFDNFLQRLYNITHDILRYIHTKL